MARIGILEMMPHENPRYSVETIERDSPEDRAAILEVLMDYNRRNAPPPDFKLLGLLLKGSDGRTIGGLWGRSGYQWLFVEMLIVPEVLRSRGVGTALMRQAEAVARARGCVGVWLDTFGFQALDFYRGLGYAVFGELQDHPPGMSRYWLQKRLGDGAADGEKQAR